MRPTAVIVGAGLMGHWHARTARRLGVDILAVVDPDSEQCQKLGRAVNATYQCGQLTDVFALASPDAIHVCTPQSTHFQMCQTGLEHGANVLCEKPLAATQQEVEALYEIAHKQQRRLTVVHQFPWQDGVRKIRDGLGKLGRVASVEFTFCTAGGERVGAPSPHDLVADILPHPLSVLQSLFPQCNLPALPWAVSSGRPGEFTAVAATEEKTVTIFISLSARPTECAMTIRGERGSWYADFFHGFSRFEAGAVSRARKALAPIRRGASVFAHASSNLGARALRREFAYPGLHSLMAEFYSATHSPATDREHALALAATRDALMSQVAR